MRVGVVIAGALLGSACIFGPSDPVHDVWIQNDSPDAYLVLIDDYGAQTTGVYEVPARSMATALAYPGPSRGGRILIMEPDCDVVAEYSISSSLAGVILHEDGSTEYANAPSKDPASQRQFRSTEECLPAG